jgi:hypothetical protein
VALVSVVRPGKLGKVVSVYRVLVMVGIVTPTSLGLIGAVRSVEVSLWSECGGVIIADCTRGYERCEGGGMSVVKVGA